MIVDAIAPPQIEIVLEEAPYIFDRIVADVTGDQNDDFIYIVGQKESPDSIYQENITIYVVDGVTNELYEQPLPLLGGYNSSLFIGDFNRDYIPDVYVSIDSDKGEDLNQYYIYSFAEKEQIQLLDYKEVNKLYEWEITFGNGYHLIVENLTLNRTYHLDISDIDEEILTKYYKKNAKVKESAQGAVLSLGALTPMMAIDGDKVYNLVATLPIVASEEERLGTIELYLNYESGEFIPYEILIGNRIPLKE